MGLGTVLLRRNHGFFVQSLFCRRGATGLALKMDTATQALAEALEQGRDGASLSKAITLCESRRPEHRLQAASLLQHLVTSNRHVAESSMFRIGLTGPPGVGKSSLIERLGLCAIRSGEHVAVLAVDPSSDRSGGSILGDKTRMDELAHHPHAFIRPSPSRGHVGGVAVATADTAILCEAAGYTVLMVETVGGGQADTAIAEFVDALLLVLPPAGGDELQGLKKGIVEHADVAVVNKADGDMKHAAGLAVNEYKSALHLLRPRSPNWTPPVLACSARTGEGVDAVWDAMCAFKRAMHASGEMHARHTQQRRSLLWTGVRNAITERLRSDPQLKKAMEYIEDDVIAGKLSIAAAGQIVANDFWTKVR